jgi:NAD(P) transhydrogenase
LSELSGAGTATFQQAGLLGGAGIAIGSVLASGVGPTELPQTVAAFHSLVGLAAMAGAAGEYLGHSGSLGNGILASIYLATFIGGVTFAGSLVRHFSSSFDILRALFSCVFLHVVEL